MKKFSSVAIFVCAVSVPLISFALGPYLVLSSQSLPPGSQLTVQGFDFGPSTNVLVSFAGTSTGAIVTNGSFSARLTVPVATPGSYTVLATSLQREQASAQFNIEASRKGNSPCNVTLAGSSLGEFHYNNCPNITALLSHVSSVVRKFSIEFQLKNASGTVMSYEFDKITMPVTWNGAWH